MLRHIADHPMSTPCINSAPFPAHLSFPDVEPEILAREELVFSGPWNEYLRKFLPPLLPS